MGGLRGFLASVREPLVPHRGGGPTLPCDGLLTPTDLGLVCDCDATSVVAVLVPASVAHLSTHRLTFARLTLRVAQEQPHKLAEEEALALELWHDAGSVFTISE